MKVHHADTIGSTAILSLVPNIRVLKEPIDAKNNGVGEVGY